MECCIKEKFFTQTSLCAKDASSKPVIIGIPKENSELRLPFTPEGVQMLVDAGYEVIFESGAGTGIGCSDLTFSEAGAFISNSRTMAFCADMVFKITAPTAEEAALLKERAIIFSFLQLDAFSTKSFNILQQKKITAFAYNLMKDEKIADDVSEIVRQVSISAVSEQTMFAERSRSTDILDISTRVACAATQMLSDILIRKLTEYADAGDISEYFTPYFDNGVLLIKINGN